MLLNHQAKSSIGLAIFVRSCPVTGPEHRWSPKRKAFCTTPSISSRSESGGTHTCFVRKSQVKALSSAYEPVLCMKTCNLSKVTKINVKRERSFHTCGHSNLLFSDHFSHVSGAPSGNDRQQTSHRAINALNGVRMKGVRAPTTRGRTDRRP